MKNSKLILSAAVAVSAMLSIGAASAADLAVKAMPYAAPVPIFSWTGCYVGVHAGAGVMHDTWTDENGTGGLAGGQLGCNYQDGNWVFGLEGEGYWSGIKATFTNGSFQGIPNISTAKNKNDFSIAARAGITFDRTLIYGKAGWVWGQFDFANTASDCCFGNIAVPSTFSKSGTLDGLLLGVGIEHALTKNWTVKLEYNYLNYGSKAMAETFCVLGTCSPSGSSSDHATKQIFKVGANYLFNWGSAPLVAKY